MNWLLIIIGVPALILWKLLYLRDKREERDELVKAIREELHQVRNEILEEIRSVNK